MAQALGRLRPLLLPGAIVLALIMVLPPFGSYARQNAVAQALQFAVFASAVPALLVLGWLARPIRLGRAALVAHSLRIPPGLARRPAARAWAALLPSLALVVVWRVPAVLAAMGRDPALTALELLSLVAAGCALWAELAGPRVARDPLPRPLRATMAAVEMWSI